MEYRLIFASNESMAKLSQTRRFPWEAVLMTNPFQAEYDKHLNTYAKAYNAISYDYQKKAQKNKAEGITENVELTPEQQEARETEYEELLCREVPLVGPKIDAKYFKVLYLPEKPKKKKKKEEDNDPESEEPQDLDRSGKPIVFTKGDMDNYYKLGLYVHDSLVESAE